MKELRDAVEEVEGLWNEEKEEGFGKMPENPADREDHAREVTVRVADENS